MLFTNIEKVKIPIVYIALSLLMSSIFYGILDGYRGLALFLATLFFVFILFVTGKEFTIMIFIIFVLGVTVNSSFYKANINEEFLGTIRIVEEKSYYNIGSYKGKRVIVNNKDSGKLGDRINVKGKFLKDINKELGTIGTLEIEKSKILDEDILRRVYSIRNNIYSKLKENLGQRKAALVTSLSFGYDEYLDQQDEEEMRNLGIIHAISVSGLHVSLIYFILKRLLGNKLAIALTCIYVVLTGIPFSSIRALIMIICSSSALSFRKRYNSLGGLALSAIIIVLIKPYSVFQLGFILSFSATLGIILFSNKLGRELYKIPKYISDTISISISAQVFTLPVMIVAFKEFSLSFIIGNIIVVPILNLIIILGNMSLLFCFIQNIFDYLSFILIKVVDVLDLIVENLYVFTNPTFVVHKSMAMVYTCMLIGLYLVYKGHKKMIILPIASIICVVISIYSPFLRVDYLREGGVLLSYRGNRTIVTNKRNIDIGKLKKENLARNSILEGENIRIDNNMKLKRHNKNFVLYLEDKKYLLRINNRSKIEENYDIINFIDDNITGFIILNNDIFLY